MTVMCDGGGKLYSVQDRGIIVSLYINLPPPKIKSTNMTQPMYFSLNLSGYKVPGKDLLKKIKLA